MHKPLYADVIIPVAAGGTFTYMISDEHRDIVDRGIRVVVQFGSKKLYTGIVSGIHSNPPKVEKVKKILEITGNRKLIDENQFSLWIWMAQYYLCTIGEVMGAALPAALKIESKSTITLTGSETDGEDDDSSVQLLINLLKREGAVTIDKLPEMIGNEPVLKVVNRMIDSGVLVAGEKPVERYKPREELFISLDPGYGEKKLHNLIDTLSKSPARQNLLNRYLEMISWDGGIDFKKIRKSDLLAAAGTSTGPLNEMVKRGIFKTSLSETIRLFDSGKDHLAPRKLSNAQNIALGNIKDSFANNDITLLRGVTSSGKTEIYIHLISQAILEGKQVLYLLPEIALTTQMINRLKRHFGDNVGVYHSRFSDNERVEVWRRTSGESKSSKFKIILGVRSSLFLPFTDLGLVIVDEEHENSYKQQDPAPRYNARDCAIMLAGFHKAKTLLGSATPSIESMHNAKTGRFGYVQLDDRFGDVNMPEMILADTRDAYRRKMMVSHFTPQLILAIEEALSKKEQVVLFRNRRGFVPIIQCRECGWIPGCRSCSVNMTYHKGLNRMKCHYCGYTSAVPNSCDSCKSTDLIMKGFGTEKIEDELNILFPGARIVRMDLDTTRRKGSLERIISNLEKRRTDILIGTQMISKGLDFENLTVVGILNVDNMLYFPDFRSHEKCFQMIEQVSGRAGRRSKQGKVILQTFDPNHSVMIQAIHHNYDAMYESQLGERRDFHYPPFTRLIKIYIRHRDRKSVRECAIELAKGLRRSLGNRILGPEAPPLSRLQAYYIMSIIVKIEKGKSLSRAKNIIKSEIANSIASGSWTGIRIHTDVDPV